MFVVSQSSNIEVYFLFLKIPNLNPNQIVKSSPFKFCLFRWRDVYDEIYVYHVTAVSKLFQRISKVPYCLVHREKERN